MLKNSLPILLIVGILILVNVLSNRFFLRLDLTADKQYTLSKATKDILKNLKEPVTVTAYFSENLPADVAKTRRDFQDMLVEYANLSKGDINYEFIAPNDDSQKQRAAQAGIQPLMINVREKDQVKQQQAFMGAVVKMGNRQETIPFVQPGAAMEYDLSTNIKKLSVINKPTVALLQGHGEPSLGDLTQAYQSLSILYSLESLVFDSTTATIPDTIRAVAVVAPRDSFPPHHLAALDAYLNQGGKLVLALNAVTGDLQSSQGIPINTGLERWLQTKGIQIQNAFLIDAQCGSVTVQQQQGFFTMSTPIQFPFLPIITTFSDHPITKGLEQVFMPFSSPLHFKGGNGKWTPIAFSSAKSGTVAAPTMFDINKKWAAADFPMSNLTVVGVLEGAGNAASKMVVIGDGDFPVSGERGQSEDNISLLVNSIDWLSDDTGLIELRTKGVASRPIDQALLLDDADAKRNLLKYLNFGLPILLVVVYGFFRNQRQRSIRMRRMEESYQ